jgi:hypothetical protein
MQAVSIREKLANVPGIEPGPTVMQTRHRGPPGHLALALSAQTLAYILHTYCMIATATNAGNTCTQVIEPATPPLISNLILWNLLLTNLF